MTDDSPKTTLRSYLQQARDAAVWKLEGLSDYDVRRPVTSTGTNLLGLIKHLASLEFGYFGDTFARPSGEPMPWWSPEAEPNADMWATADQSREWVLDLYRRSWAHADATFEELDLAAVGHVPWWTPGNAPTLHHIAVHMIAETHRHAGHADIVRELIDGQVGIASDDSNLPPVEQQWWPGYRERLEAVAQSFR